MIRNVVRNVEIYLYVILSLLPFVSFNYLIKFLVSPRIFIKNAVSYTCWKIHSAAYISLFTFR